VFYKKKIPENKQAFRAGPELKSGPDTESTKRKLPFILF